MQIVHVAAELAPIAKVGGMGDVLYGLCKATPHSEVILPKYATLPPLPGLKLTSEIKILFNGKKHVARIYRCKFETIDLTLIEDPLGFFNRNTIYGHPDDTERFLFFSAAALETLRKRKTQPDIIHIHDWHTAPIALFAKEGLPWSSRIVLTIHNLAYQGIISKETFLKTGLATDRWSAILADDNYPGSFNLLKGGIICADAVTTVSPNYAKEVLTPLGGGTLYPTLLRYRDKLTGILNGIDYTYWDPAKDPFLPSHFSAADLDCEGATYPLLPGKGEIRAHLSRLFNLEREDSPLVVAVARLVAQKGPALIKQALYTTLERGGQFILLGSAPDAETAGLFAMLKHKLTGCRHVHFELSFSEELSHLVYGAADLVLVPSLFEPCGLTQMIAMRYGALPVVRETGGLVDTVRDSVNGFSFFYPTSDGIQWALDRAFLTFKEPLKWKGMLKNAMTRDWSWQAPAAAYLSLYTKLLTPAKV